MIADIEVLLTHVPPTFQHHNPRTMPGRHEWTDTGRLMISLLLTNQRAMFDRFIVF